METRPASSAIWTINGRFLKSAFGFAVAYAFWPQTKEAWGWGLFSLLFGLGALGHFFGTISIIRDHLKRDRSVRRYASKGEKAKGDRLASRDAQRNKGMID